MKKQDNSIGIIPVHKTDDGPWLFCAILQCQGHWTFPKGHPDAGEAKITTAKRELFEETGLMAEEIWPDKVLIEKYSFEKEGVGYDKTVEYFIGLVNSTKIAIPQEFKQEIKDARWGTAEEIRQLLTFSSIKEVFEEVIVTLSERHK
ncbi:MAG: NUDIX domain-containing protein [Candidatus Paceibacterota bacterium]